VIDTPSLLLGPKVQGLFARALEKAEDRGFGKEELIRALRSGDPGLIPSSVTPSLRSYALTLREFAQGSAGFMCTEAP
jgi:hypothetical protein